MPGEIAVPEKAGETTAIPEPLGLIDVEGNIASIGALVRRKATAERIFGKGADYAIALKENQPTLCEDVKSHFESFGSEI